jgi:hypothetical protein
MRSTPYALFAVPLAIAIVACGQRAPAPPPVTAPVASAAPAPPVRHAAGDACPGHKGLECVDPGSALVCQHDVFLRIPCRGPGGCHGEGEAAKCDDDIMAEGDACQVPSAGDNLGCSVDGLKELRCDQGVARVDRTCRGPKKCTIAGDVLHCDDTIAEVGDLCEVEAGEDNFGCSTDSTIEVICDRATSRFTIANTCRGPKHCRIEDDKVYCDQSTGRLGDVCRPVDNHSCAEDATIELKCSPQGTWLKQRACGPSGCIIRDGNVYCGDPAPPPVKPAPAGKKAGAAHP